MYAMQYRIALPADYDMRIIHDRVRTTGHRMNGFGGLEFKTYLVQEKAKGAPNNAYAPFYIWRDIDGMRDFCWGQLGYSAIVRDFGRQPIQDWTVHQFVRGPVAYADARSLTMTTVALPADSAPSSCLNAVTEEFLASNADSIVARVTAVDVTTWRAILVELSSKDIQHATTGEDVYEVLHVSTAA